MPLLACRIMIWPMFRTPASLVTISSGVIEYSNLRFECTVTMISRKKERKKKISTMA